MKSRLPSISRSFSTRLSLFITFIVAGLFVISFSVFFWYSRHIIRQEAMGQAEAALSKTVLRIENILNAVEVAVDNMDWVVKEQLAHPDSIYGITRRILENNPSIVGSAIAFEPDYYQTKGKQFSPYSYKTNKGSIITKQLGTEDYEYHYMDWYQIPKLLNRPYWSEPYFDEGGGQVIMTTYSKPLYDATGKMYAIFTADVSLEWLTKLVNNIHPYPHSYNLMVGRGGTYIVHHRPERILSETIFTATVTMTDTTVTQIGHAMVEGRKGMSTLQNDDTLSYVFYTPVPSTGWSMAVVCPHEDVFAPVDRMERIVFIVVGVGLILLLLILVQTVKRITRPLRRFAESAVSIAEGNFDTSLPNIRSKDEMWLLHQSFDFMQHSLTNYIEELRTTTAGKERIESELRIASEIQMGMIPKIFPPFPDRDDVDLYAALIPAKEVGGDLYDFFIENNRLYIAIGDVSGKGVPASLLMAVTRSLFRTVANHLHDPAAIVTSINESISETNESNMFVTLFIGVLDLETGHFSYCNAGHNPPVIITPEKEVCFLNVQANIPVGLFAEYSYQDQEMLYKAGSTLFFYTDGLTEAENMNKELYTAPRLLEELSKQSTIGSEALKPCTLVNHILQQVKEHSGEAEQSDDLTILAIYYQQQNKDNYEETTQNCK